MYQSACRQNLLGDKIESTIDLRPEKVFGTGVAQAILYLPFTLPTYHIECTKTVRGIGRSGTQPPPEGVEALVRSLDKHAVTE